MKNVNIFALSVLALATAIGCGSSQQPVPGPAKPDILFSNLDTTVHPGDDFFLYANGGWFKKNPIPETESRWGIGNLVSDAIYEQLKTVCEQAAAKTDHQPGSGMQKIGDLYFSAMDSVNIDQQGVTPLENELKMISEIKDVKGVLSAIAQFQVYGAAPAFGCYVAQDDMNSEVMSFRLVQGGLGLPNKDYYFKNDERTKKVREEYVKHVERTLINIGYDEKKAAQSAKDIMRLETWLAKNSRELEELRDPYANYNKKSMADLDKLTPSIKWKEVFGAMMLPGMDSVIVGQPEFYSALDKSLSSFSISTWQDYLKWHLVASFASKLGGRFEAEDFAFYKGVLFGAKKQKPRWKRVIDYQNEAMGELLGQLFVKEYFPAETKERYSNMVDAVMESYKEHIQKLPWMSAATKEKALKKLSTITKKVGYPDKWKDFSSMNISRQPFVRNAINVNTWWHKYYVDKIGKPVDRTEWQMNPQEYNAYYNPSNNEIVLPAAIFSVLPGYKDSELDDAVVYGYAGASTIGHELTHGFDDEGRQFDEKGNLSNWWTREDEEAFLAIANKYVEQFNNYVVLDSLHVNGKATLGENIADLGGVAIALDAFKKTEQYKKGEKIAGLTPIQRYFLGYALGWLMHMRDERLASMILTDVHSPAHLRVNGPFSNIPEFYEAFGVKEGQKMYRAPGDRVVIW
ncbi:MAG: M13 family metallopeptidase [Bacteroidota bacterium]